ncbi:MAG: glycosyl transferase [Kiritimatiellae bacterium]|nr:glycosyl transferase [Kiritimatiellia bacterium]
MIPKVIHYCWFGRGKKSAKFQMCLDSWRKILPEYRLKEWNEDNFDVNIIPYTKEAYQARKWAHVTDYVRLYALYNEGGVYMDSDVEVLKPLDRFLCNVAFTGYEAVGKPLTGIMASEKRGKWVEDLMRDYDGRHFLGEDGNPDLTQNTKYAYDVMKRAGMRLDQTEEDVPCYVHVYPADYFCPKVWGSGDKVKVTENTYTIHHYVSSWLPWQGKVARWFGEHHLPRVGYFVAYFLRRPDIVFLDLLDFTLIKLLKVREKPFLRINDKK